MPCDLHVHTTASDGADAPGKVVEKARRAGLSALAITDHDTVGGLLPALDAGTKLSFPVLPGVELSTEEEGHEIHILGYLFQIDHSELLARLALFRQARVERVVKMVERLRCLGIPVEVEQVLELAGEGAVGRPHVARALVQVGAVATVGEAFEKYIGKDRVAYVPRYKYTPREAVRLLRRAGGVAVLAHPGLVRCDHLIPRLVAEGLQGLEVFYPAHSEEMVWHYERLCRRYRLVATGGSDYHGSDHREYNRLGAATAPDEVISILQELARQGPGT